MTIQELGSIGELIAAIATVATLAYLAVQIRANTRAMQAESRRTEINTSAAIAQSIVADPEVARLFNSGMADLSSLSPEDQTRFSLLLGNFVGADASIFEEAEIGVIPRHMVDHRAENLRAFLCTPGGREYWRRFHRRYPVAFQEFVEREVLRSRA